jgi:hypothetical protein
LLARGVRTGRDSDDQDTHILDLETPPWWFHEGQLAAWAAGEEVVLLLCGTQSGKSIFLIWWLLREIQRRGPGDYGLNGPTLVLLKKKMLPALIQLLEYELKLGRYNRADQVFRFSPRGMMKLWGTVQKKELFERFGYRDPETGQFLDPEFAVQASIHVGYAAKPESLESATYKAVISDECGQPDFKLESYEALVRRRSRYNGRHCLGTTPYDLGWIKLKLYDVAVKAGIPEGAGPYCDGATDGKGEDLSYGLRVIRFESWLNPVFGKEKFEAIRRSGMMPWKFDLFYRAIFTRPAGAIYDTFDETLDTYEPFEIPSHWPRVAGVDFGQTNTAAWKMAMDPASYDPAKPGSFPDFYVYGTYHTGGRDVEEHIISILSREPVGTTLPAVGGARSEDEWRAKYAAAGWYIERPMIGDVEAGIDSVYGLFKRHKLKVSKKLTKLIADIKEYSRELDPMGEALPNTIANKAKYHRLDAGRYVCSEVVHNPTFWVVGRSTEHDDEPLRPEDLWEYDLLDVGY